MSRHLEAAPMPSAALTTAPTSNADSSVRPDFGLATTHSGPTVTSAKRTVHEPLLGSIELACSTSTPTASLGTSIRAVPPSVTTVTANAPAYSPWWTPTFVPLTT